MIRCGLRRSRRNGRLFSECSHDGSSVRFSTAIPKLAAKPVIDIMAGVQALDASRPAIQAATELGYCYSAYRPETEHWFCKPSPFFRTHHLHLIPVGSPQWIEPIAFRDYLRTHAEVAAEYETLKRQLAQEHQFDREAYTEAKRPFIARITAVALDEGYGSNDHGRRSRPA
jgi:GrpB-like predicted nucleotidyltransferase (UPF0157 family)